MLVHASPLLSLSASLPPCLPPSLPPCLPTSLPSSPSPLPTCLLASLFLSLPPSSPMRKNRLNKNRIVKQPNVYMYVYLYMLWPTRTYKYIRNFHNYHFHKTQTNRDIDSIFFLKVPCVYAN